MGIVICFNNKDPEPWFQALQKSLKEVPIAIYPQVEEPESILFALCWKPDREILSQFPNLKVVQSAGASVAHILRTQNLSDDILVTRIVDDQLSEDMFSYILTGILSHIRGVYGYGNDKRLKQWVPRPYGSIKDTSLGILGLGEIGSYVAQRLAQLGFRVKAWSRSRKQLENVTCFHGDKGLPLVFRDTDILINILPWTRDTEHILDYQRLKCLNPGGYLINVGRGESLMENDLIQLLDSGYLSGALLDVFQMEPLPKDHPFWDHEKIQMTPHIAAITNVASACKIVSDNYMALRSGKRPLRNEVVKTKI